MNIDETYENYEKYSRYIGQSLCIMYYMYEYSDVVVFIFL